MKPSLELTLTLTHCPTRELMTAAVLEYEGKP